MFYEQGNLHECKGNLFLKSSRVGNVFLLDSSLFFVGCLRVAGCGLGPYPIKRPLSPKALLGRVSIPGVGLFGGNLNDVRGSL